MATNNRPPSSTSKLATAGLSQTTPVDDKKRKIVSIKVWQPVIVFYIGGAGDKKSFYGTGPYGNVNDIHTYCEGLFGTLRNNQLYFREYLGYDEIANEIGIHNNVIDKIPNLATPIYIVGHSLGGWNGAHLSAILTKRGYRVEILITLDPVGAGLVKLVANIYFSKPVPKAKFWINIRAEAKEMDSSDVIADAGGQWSIESGPDLNYIAPIHHANAFKMFLVPLGKLSARDFLCRDYQIYNAMIKFLLIPVIAALTVGCHGNHPTATIAFEKIYKTQSGGFIVQFNSDIDFEALYSSNKYRKIVRKFLTCSLSNDENFDVEHQLQYEYTGRVELASKPSDLDKKFYRYTSFGNFHENVSSPSSKPLWGQSLQRLLDSKKAIPCRVIMTVYLSSPYYSNVMLVPTDAIKIAAIK